MLCRIERFQSTRTNQFSSQGHGVAEPIVTDGRWIEGMKRKDAVGSADATVPVTPGVEMIDMLSRGFMAPHAGCTIHFHKAPVVTRRHDVK
jgi:hypothetical protein